MQVIVGQPDFGPKNEGGDPGLITLKTWTPTKRRAKCGKKYAVTSTINMCVIQCVQILFRGARLDLVVQ